MLFKEPTVDVYVTNLSCKAMQRVNKLRTQSWLFLQRKLLVSLPKCKLNTFRKTDSAGLLKSHDIAVNR